MQKIFTNFPKFYICEYGAFYEGQKLIQYNWNGGNNYSYSQIVILEKFLFHYYNYIPHMYFRVRELHTKKSWSLPCKGYLGITYKKY